MEKYQREKDELSLRVALELQSRYQAMFDARLVSFGDELGMLNPHKAQETLQAYIDSSFHAYQLLASSAGEDDGVKKKQTGKACGATGQSSTPSFLYRLLSIFGRSR
jgi:hypothetical protein